MKHAMATTVSRRAWLSRLLMAAAVAPVVGVRLADDAAAEKKSKKKQKKRVKSYKDTCEADKGTATVEKRPGGTTVTCTGGKESGDWSCTVSSQKDRCHVNLTNSPATKAGGGGAVPPSGGNEDPTDGGGNNPGGGAHVPPGGGAEDPSDSPDGGPVLT